MNTALRILIWLPLVLAYSTSCSTTGATEENASEAAITEVQQPRDPHAPLDAEFHKLPIEMRQALIWDRLQGLNEELATQRARMRVLEKGLMLGVIPDELKHPDDLEYARRRSMSIETEAKDSAAKPIEASKETVAPVDPGADVKNATSGERPKDSRSFVQRLAEAQDLIKTGRYGRAIVEFESLHRDFPEETKDGSHFYWIGVSWFQLKEHELANQAFSKLTKDFQTSPWLPRAELYLAKIERVKGLRESALKALRSVIEKYPADEAAAMARQELLLLEQSL